MLLPLELTRGIVERIDYTPTLVVLSRTSNLFQYESERLLYRSMTKEDGTKSFQFLSNIKNSLRRAALVRLFHVHTIVQKQRDSIWDLINSTLPLMINLKELAYRRTITSKPYQIFPLHPRFQLETFIWAVDSPGCQYHLAVSRRPLYEGQAFQFLESQPQLRNLLWNSPNPSNVVPSHLLCPNLTSIQGNTHILNIFLPGRSITTVNLMPHLDGGMSPTPDEEILESIFLHMNTWASFSLKEYPWLKRDYFLVLVQHLRSLKTLELSQLNGIDIVRLLFNSNNRLFRSCATGPYFPLPSEIAEVNFDSASWSIFPRTSKRRDCTEVLPR